MTRSNRPLTPFGKLQRGWGSMAKLARDCQISLSTIRRLVYGEGGHEPHPLTVARLAEIMHIEVGKLDRLLRPSWQQEAKEKAETRPAVLEETVEEVRKDPWWKRRQPAPFGEKKAAELKKQRDEERIAFLKRKKLVNEEKKGSGDET